MKKERTEDTSSTGRCGMANCSTLATKRKMVEADPVRPTKQPQVVLHGAVLLYAWGHHVEHQPEAPVQLCGAGVLGKWERGP